MQCLLFTGCFPYKIYYLLISKSTTELYEQIATSIEQNATASTYFYGRDNNEMSNVFNVKWERIIKRKMGTNYRKLCASSGFDEIDEYMKYFVL